MKQIRLEIATDQTKLAKVGNSNPFTKKIKKFENTQKSSK